jgi:hypothetical protein
LYLLEARVEITLLSLCCRSVSSAEKYICTPAAQFMERAPLHDQNENAIIYKLKYFCKVVA